MRADQRREILGRHGLNAFETFDPRLRHHLARSASASTKRSPALAQLPSGADGHS
jgi:hypothetical protein